MEFFKPHKPTIAIFCFFMAVMAGSLIGNLVGNYDEPSFLMPAGTVRFFMVNYSFSIFKGMGLDVGTRTDWFGFPSPNALGWVLILFLNAIIFYLIACLISHFVKDEKTGKIMSAILIIIIASYISLILVYSVNAGKKNEKLSECSNKCLQLYETPKKECSDKCISSPETSFECSRACDSQFNNLIRECNEQCISKTP